MRRVKKNKGGRPPTYPFRTVEIGGVFNMSRRKWSEKTARNYTNQYNSTLYPKRFEVSREAQRFVVKRIA